MTLKRIVTTGVIFLFAASLYGCSLLGRNSPDTAYVNAKDAEALEVPPDLARPDKTIQLAIPGRLGDTLTSSTLLPQFEKVRFVRRGGSLHWLEVDLEPEVLWPQMLAFWESQSFVLEEKDPLIGLIETEWVRDGKPIPKRGLKAFLRKALGNFFDSDNFDRFTMRIERQGSQGSRIFLSHLQAVDLEQRDEYTQETLQEGLSLRNDPQVEVEMLKRFLVFLGATEQMAQGILSRQAFEKITQGSTLEAGESGLTLFVRKPASALWPRLLRALDALEISVEEADLEQQRLELLLEKRTESAESDAELLTLLRENDGKTIILDLEEESAGTYFILTDDKGRQLDREINKTLLEKLQAQLDQ